MVNILIKKEINKSEVENKEEDFTISSEVLWKYFLTRINLNYEMIEFGINNNLPIGKHTN